MVTVGEAIAMIRTADRTRGEAHTGRLPSIESSQIPHRATGPGGGPILRMLFGILRAVSSTGLRAQPLNIGRTPKSLTQYTLTHDRPDPSLVKAR